MAEAPYEDEDAQAFYEAAKERFAWQEGRAERFASRGRHLGAVLAGLGGGAFFFGQGLVESKVAACSRAGLLEGACGAWLCQLCLVLLLAAVVVVGGIFTVLVLWSASYDRPCDPETYWNIWEKAKTLRVSRRAGVWMYLADVLLAAAKTNDKVDEKRQFFLDVSKWASAVGACVLVFVVASSFWTSVLAQSATEKHPDARSVSETQLEPKSSAQSSAQR